MSENIQSISLGTYSIGNTNELTFSAGPGIKIDSPSAGTVRIGNDETVLWEAGNISNRTSACTASEPFTNFEHVDLWIAHGTYGPARCVSLDMNSFGTNTGYFSVMRPRGTSNLNVAFMKYEFNNSAKTMNCTMSKCLVYGGYASTGVSVTATLNDDEDRKSIYKIVGINRISNA